MHDDDPISILVAMAHPDDAEIFCAGTMALLLAGGHKVSVLTMTAGGLGSYNKNVEEIEEIRFNEASSAASLIHATYSCLHLKDGFVYDTPDSRTALIHRLRRLQPDLVITHLPDDYHPDHRATSSMVEAACLLSTLPNISSPSAPLKRTPVLYHAAPLHLVNHLGYPFIPSFGVDISTVIEIKRSMISAHKSQVDLMQHMFRVTQFVEDMLDAHDRKLGARFGVPYAEGYVQHLGGGFNTQPVLQQVLGGKTKRTTD